MKKFLMLMALVFVLTSPACADTKVSALPADTTPTTDDLVMTVNDPGGTPVSKKVTLANFRTLMLAGNGSTLTGLTKTQVGLGNVENTALSTWAGSANITTLGTIATGSIPESKLTFTDITTGNASSAKHGLLPKLSNDSASFLNGAGGWSVPAGSGSGGGGGGSGSVTSLSVVTANGLAGTVATSTTTPAITLQTTASGILKGNGTSISGATSGVDYAPATSGNALLKGNGSGGFSNAASGSDYAPATTGSAILKGNGSGGFTNTTAGTDYISPTGTETMTNKTLTAPTIATITNTGTLTLPISTDTLVGRATTDTLTNKTFNTASTGNVFKINNNNISDVNGNTAIVATVSGATTNTHCSQWDANGNLVDSGATCGSGGGGSGTVSSGTAGQLGYYATSSNVISGLSQIGNSYINWTSMTAANQSVNWGSGAQYAASWNSTTSGVGGLKMFDSGGINWVSIAAPSSIPASVTWTLPSTDGSKGQGFYTNGSGTLAWTSNVINVKTYGATGDGSTDDTTAIQNAMNAAAGTAILYFPKPATYYKVTSTLRLLSNLTIRGDNSKIHMPAQANEASINAIFDTNNGATTSNVDISGLYVESANTVTGTGNNSTGYYDGATTSFVMGFNLHNTSDIRIHDCTLDALAYGLKIDTTLNTHLFFNNLKIINSGTNIYGSNITDAYFGNMYLDSTSYTATNGHLHNFYFETTVQDIYFNNVSMNNTAGGCMQIYQSGGTAAKNIQGKNLTCNTAADMFIIWTGTKDVRIDGWRAKGVTKVLNYDDAHNVQLSHGYVELKQYLATTGSSTSDHITFDNLQMDASTASSNADFIDTPGEGFFTLMNSDIYGINANDRIVNNTTPAMTNLRILNNSFQYAATPADNVIILRHANSTASIIGNRFINSAAATTNAVMYAPSTLGNMVFANNTVTGFPKSTAGSDTATIDIDNVVNGKASSLGTMVGNYGIGTWSPSTMFEVGTKNFNITSGGNVGVGSVNPQKALDIGPGLGVRAVGVGTTVPAPLCRKSDGTFGTYTGTAWANVCN